MSWRAAFRIMSKYVLVTLVSVVIVLAVVTVILRIWMIMIF